MRKNKKLLLASVAAMGALALGVGATSTFAWYKASSATTISTYTPDTKGVTTEAGEINVGNFVVKAVPGNPSNNVQLSTTAGKSYIFTAGEVGEAGSGKVEVPLTAAAGIATIGCDLSVKYVSKSGEAAKTADEIATIWLETISTKSIGIKATGGTTVRFLASGSPENAAAWEGTAGATGVTTISVASGALRGLSFAACTGNGAEAAATSNASGTGSVYVAVTGNDTNVENAASANVTITFTPQTAA